MGAAVAWCRGCQFDLSRYLGEEYRPESCSRCGSLEIDIVDMEVKVPEPFLEPITSGQIPSGTALFMAALGFPVPESEKELFLKNRVTLTMIGACALSILALGHLTKPVVMLLGFVAADPLRFLGLPVLTHVFVHDGLDHLLGNVYFWILFGAPIEYHLGIRRYLGLMLFAAAGSCIGEIFFSSAPWLPSVGASGVVAGLMGYYAVEFPERRICWLLCKIYWVRMPAVLVAAVYFLFDLSAMGSGDYICHSAHLGGAIFGALFALMARDVRLSLEPTTEAKNLKLPSSG